MGEDVSRIQDIFLSDFTLEVVESFSYLGATSSRRTSEQTTGHRHSFIDILYIYFWNFLFYIPFGVIGRLLEPIPAACG